MEHKQGSTSLVSTGQPLTINDLIAAQQRAYDAHNQGAKPPRFTLQEVNDHDLQAIASSIVPGNPDTAYIYGLIETRYAKVSGDEDVPENTLRVWTGEGDSQAFFDHTIRREHAVANAVAANPPRLASSAREKVDLANALERVIGQMQAHGPTTQGALKSREMSTAVTYAETALLWLDTVPIPD